MFIPIRTAVLLLPLLAIACGSEPEEPKAKTRIVEPPEPKDIVAEVKLQVEAYRTYYYCDKEYSQTCDDLPQAYVLKSEGSEGPYRLVFFNNQDRHSTPATFDYVSIDWETKAITAEGHFEWQVVAGVTTKKGEPLWGIPE